MDDYDNWQPPSEADMKLLQARRERSDKISKLMGDYLLKGYKMLGISCRECDTILLQTKQGTNYCIACSELDSDADKDDPVTNQAAALALAREREIIMTPPRSTASYSQSSSQCSPELSGSQTQGTASGQFEISSTSAREIPVRNQGVNASTHTSNLLSYSDILVGGSTTRQQTATGAGTGEGDSAATGGRGGGGDGQKYVKELLDKMDWAVAELRATRNVDYSIQLCQLIKASAEAVSSVRAALDS